MSLKDYGWETYRVRSHSIPPSVSNTDNYQGGEPRLSKSGTSSSSSPRKSMSLQVTPPPPPAATPADILENTARRELTEPTSADVVPHFRSNIQQDSNSSDVKSKRSLTMPTTILLNVNEKTDVRNGKSKLILFSTQ